MGTIKNECDTHGSLRDNKQKKKICNNPDRKPGSFCYKPILCEDCEHWQQI